MENDYKDYPEIHEMFCQWLKRCSEKDLDDLRLQLPSMNDSEFLLFVLLHAIPNGNVDYYYKRWKISKGTAKWLVVNMAVETIFLVDMPCQWGSSRCTGYFSVTNR
jgi:hypothetical protein